MWSGSTVLRFDDGVRQRVHPGYEQEAKAAGRGMWGPPCFGQTTSVPEWFVEVARGLSRHRRCDQRLNAQSGPPMSMARTETQELESRLNWFALLFTQI